MFAGPLGRSTFTPPSSSFESPLYGLVSLRRSHEGVELVRSARIAKASGAYFAALQVFTRENAPGKWAITQTDLGLALRTLGMRESETGTARLQEAVTAFSAALEVFTRDDMPFEWAGIQTNLGDTLRNLGQREPGTTRLEAAFEAYSAALEVDGPHSSMASSNLERVRTVIEQRSR